MSISLFGPRIPFTARDVSILSPLAAIASGLSQTNFLGFSPISFYNPFRPIGVRSSFGPFVSSPFVGSFWTPPAFIPQPLSYGWLYELGYKTLFGPWERHEPPPLPDLTYSPSEEPRIPTSKADKIPPPPSYESPPPPTTTAAPAPSASKAESATPIPEEKKKQIFKQVASLFKRAATASQALAKSRYHPNEEKKRAQEFAKLCRSAAVLWERVSKNLNLSKASEAIELVNKFQAMAENGTDPVARLVRIMVNVGNHASNIYWGNEDNIDLSPFEKGMAVESSVIADLSKIEAVYKKFFADFDSKTKKEVSDYTKASVLQLTNISLVLARRHNSPEYLRAAEAWLHVYEFIKNGYSTDQISIAAQYAIKQFETATNKLDGNNAALPTVREIIAVARQVWGNPVDIKELETLHSQLYEKQQRLGHLVRNPAAPAPAPSPAPAIPAADTAATVVRPTPPPPPPAPPPPAPPPPVARPAPAAPPAAPAPSPAPAPVRPAVDLVATARAEEAEKITAARKRITEAKRRMDLTVAPARRVLTDARVWLESLREQPNSVQLTPIATAAIKDIEKIVREVETQSDLLTAAETTAAKSDVTAAVATQQAIAAEAALSLAGEKTQAAARRRQQGDQETQAKREAIAHTTPRSPAPPPPPSPRPAAPPPPASLPPAAAAQPAPAAPSSPADATRIAEEAGRAEKTRKAEETRRTEEIRRQAEERVRVEAEARRAEEAKEAAVAAATLFRQKLREASTRTYAGLQADISSAGPLHGISITPSITTESTRIRGEFESILSGLNDFNANVLQLETKDLPAATKRQLANIVFQRSRELTNRLEKLSADISKLREQIAQLKPIAPQTPVAEAPPPAPQPPPPPPAGRPRPVERGGPVPVPAAPPPREAAPAPVPTPTTPAPAAGIEEALFSEGGYQISGQTVNFRLPSEIQTRFDQELPRIIERTVASVKRARQTHLETEVRIETILSNSWANNREAALLFSPNVEQQKIIDTAIRGARDDIDNEIASYVELPEYNTTLQARIRCAVAEWARDLITRDDKYKWDYSLSKEYLSLQDAFSERRGKCTEATTFLYALMRHAQEYTKRWKTDEREEYKAAFDAFDGVLFRFVKADRDPKGEKFTYRGRQISHVHLALEKGGKTSYYDIFNPTELVAGFVSTVAISYPPNIQLLHTTTDKLEAFLGWRLQNVTATASSTAAGRR